MTTPECKPMTIFWGAQECLDRDCDEYINENGDDPGTLEACSHLERRLACATHTTTRQMACMGEEYDHVEPWPCRHAIVAANPWPVEQSGRPDDDA